MITTDRVIDWLVRRGFEFIIIVAFGLGLGFSLAAAVNYMLPDKIVHVISPATIEPNVR